MATRLAILCGGILAVGLAGAANPVAAQQRDWLGTYAGIMIGHSWDRIDFSVPIGGGTSSDHSATSVIGGAQIGSYVARQGNFHFGVVADVLLLDARLDAGQLRLHLEPAGPLTVSAAVWQGSPFLAFQPYRAPAPT